MSSSRTTPPAASNTPAPGVNPFLDAANAHGKEIAAREKKDGRPNPEQVQAQYEVYKDIYAATKQQAHDDAPHGTDGFVAVARGAAAAAGAVPGIGAIPSAAINGISGVVDSIGSIVHGDSLQRKAQVAGNAAASIPINATPIGIANMGLNSVKGYVVGKVASDYATERAECKHMPEMAAKIGLDCQKYVTAAAVEQSGQLVIPDPAMPTPVVAKQILIAHGIRPDEGKGR